MIGRFLVIMLVITAPVAIAQWTNHYPKLDDFGHQIYLEQHELPIHTYGVTDPAPSPDGKSIAIASKGWIWILDINSGIATRITSAQELDSRPRWSSDGKQITFVRDQGNDTAVVLMHLATGKEMLIDSDAIDLDPEFSEDGSLLFYTSGKSGSLELYQRNIASGAEQQITSLRQVVRNTRRVANNKGIVYLHGLGAKRVLRHRDFIAGTDEIIHAQTLTYHLSSDMHPSLNLMVYSAPIDNDYHLYTMNLAGKNVLNRLTSGKSFALTPAFSANGKHIYFVELDDNRQFQLKQISTNGGKSKVVEVKQWDYGVATGTLRVSVFNGQKEADTARLSIVSEAGHPVANPAGATFVDPQTGRTYFYIDQSLSLTLPVGSYNILATKGPMSKVFTSKVSVEKANITGIDIALSLLWDSAQAGYVSADFHVHLNGDGHQRATHKDALLHMQGENLNYLAPMSWNRWERRIDSQIIGKQTTLNQQNIVQGQEVRSHFHGHVGLLNVEEPFSPWFFGHYFPALGDTDVSNADVFAYANEVGAFATYVHPVSTDGNPFADENIHEIPLELISDGILEPKMGLELVCAWTSPLGTSNLWYRLLNIGKPVSAMSGTDGWIDFHRTPAVGTARAYVRPFDSPLSSDPVVAGAIAGRSFVTTGPSLIFAVGDALPGDVIDDGKQTFSLTIASTVNLDIVEIMVNGNAIQTLKGLKAGETKVYEGTVNLPTGGWIAARTFASEQQADSWPSMHARPFAHSSPIWINKIGSTNPIAEKAAIYDLLKAIDAAQKTAKEAYEEQDMPKLYARFEKARAKLRDKL
ncbi:MAG: TolB protein [Glaciecola sp.]|jgi:TolB protein